MDQQPSTPEKHATKKKKLLRKELIKYSIFFLLIAFLVSVSAITHKYGPYIGKVVDKETGEPIEGAAVLLVFCTEGFFAVSSYAGAMETLTDKNGEFTLSKKRFLTFHPFSKWEPYCYVTIFKPGYGSFPDNKDSGPKFSYSYSIPENNYYLVKLPKLKTMEERRQNSLMLDYGNVPSRKMKNTLKNINIERAYLNYEPIGGK